MSDPGGDRRPAIIHRIYRILFRNVSHEWRSLDFAIHGVFKVLEGAFPLIGRALSRHVARSSWSRFSSLTCPFRLFVCLPLESVCHTFVPGLHCVVRLIWKALLGEHFREYRA
jgi:hypothetical protein